MSTSGPTPAHLRAKLAITTRHHPDADTTALRAELKTAVAAKYIQRLVDSAPPLTESQRAHLAALLAPSTVGSDSRAA